jgi:hypothetical protein
MQYKIISSHVGARHCRAQKSVLDSTDNRYNSLTLPEGTELVGLVFYETVKTYVKLARKALVD